jgi:NADH-quinone oxidoreductase subunit M
MPAINAHILSDILITPLLGAVLIAMLPARGRILQWTALAVTTFTLLLTLHLPFHYCYCMGGFQFVTNHAWIATPAIRYHLGVDQLSLWLVVLAGLLAPPAVLVSWNAISNRTKEFYILFLVLQTAIFGVFLSLDLILYYGFWELSLVPMALLIAVFGRTMHRRRAALKYFLYTFISSAFLLAAIIWLYAKTGTFDYVTLSQLAQAHAIPAAPHALFLASLGFLIAFAVKVPIVPLHGWLADAISEGPIAAAMVIAGKLGLYSILRFSFGIFPAQTAHVAPTLVALGAIGILYGACLALAQTDLRRLVAFSIVSHLGFCVVGIFALTQTSLDGGIYQILNHGLSGAALFLLVGYLYERYSVTDLRDLGGLAKPLPWLATCFVITTLSLIGLPILNGFVGEFLSLSGAFPVHPRWIVAATFGVVLGAAYMLWTVQRIFYGQPGTAVLHADPAHDLDVREHLSLWPLLILMLVLGVASPIFMRAIDAASSILLKGVR